MVDLMQAMAQASQAARADYHVTLGQLIEKLREIDKDTRIVVDVNGFTVESVHSYRGYYEDLGLRMANIVRRASTLLPLFENAVGETFEGWKGGDFTMHEGTPLWVSESWGDEGRAVIGLKHEDDKLLLEMREIR